MKPRRVAGIVGSVCLLLILGYEAAVDPEEASRVSHMEEGDTPPRHLKTSTLGERRYDPTTDNTITVLPCSHWLCEQAIRLEGDHTDASGGPWILTGPRTVQLEPLEPPFETYERNVTVVLAGAFSVRPLYVDITAVAAVVALMTVAVGVVLGTDRKGMVVMGGLTAVSAWLGGMSVAMWWITPLGAPLLGLWVLVILLLSTRGGRRRLRGKVVLATFAAFLLATAVFWGSHPAPSPF